jgi:hypothetical protein
MCKQVSVCLSLQRNHPRYHQPTPNDLRPSQRFAQEERSPQRCYHRLDGGQIFRVCFKRVGWYCWSEWYSDELTDYQSVLQPR